MISYSPCEGCIWSTLIVRMLWHQIFSWCHSASLLKSVLKNAFVWILSGNTVLESLIIGGEIMGMFDITSGIRAFFSCQAQSSDFRLANDIGPLTRGSFVYYDTQKNVFKGSKYPKNISFNFRNTITGTELAPDRHQLLNRFGTWHPPSDTSL